MAEAKAPEKLSYTRLLTLLAILATVLAYNGASQALGRYRFALNQTESLPNWAFIADQANRSPKRGQLVAFVPPKTPFYPAGMVFCKIVAGVPGDVVEVRGRDFYVAGHYVGRAKTNAKNGTPVQATPGGVIPRDHYFLVTPHPDSLDSRYTLIGLVPRARVLGVAKAVM
jgi:conjugal transfer pilin signal peptidase TrbI